MSTIVRETAKQTINIKEATHMNSKGYVSAVLNDVRSRYPEQKEFLQAVSEVFGSLHLILDRDPRYQKYRILERMAEPDRVYMFKVPWLDDSGNVQVNRGYRVQFNGAIGPYKGGLRFHPSVNIGILKFLGFEQTFKNCLTGLPMGGGKGGSDFDPFGKSDNEVMKFCQSFMQKLYKHIGPETDVPAGDLGVGAREIGYLFGMYKKLVNAHEAVLTGKSLSWGGSLIRPEATGYGCVYFAQEMLNAVGQDMEGKRVLISGAGNVAQYALEKVKQLGGLPLTFSEEDGVVLCEEGFSLEQIRDVIDLKANSKGRLLDKEAFVKKYSNCKFITGKKPWGLVPADIAMPCATQNEINASDAKSLIDNGLVCIAEAANMPSTPEAMEIFLENKILFGPSKAANAGGVATSGLEMSQNAMKLNWTANEVDAKLHEIMVNIHKACLNTAEEFGTPGNYVNGANIAGFKKVADAMIELGI